MATASTWLSLRAQLGTHTTTVNYGLTTIEGLYMGQSTDIFTVWCPSWRVDMPDAILPAGKHFPS